MSDKQNDEYWEQLRDDELRLCPYCDAEISSIIAGDESLDWCGECEVVLEGYTERDDEQQAQGERDLYWWETLSAEDRARHNEYRQYLETIYARPNSQ